MPTIRVESGKQLVYIRFACACFLSFLVLINQTCGYLELRHDLEAELGIIRGRRGRCFRLSGCEYPSPRPDL
ncbi:uncharacterized protein B0H64DRAFT_386452 [Chaetomium fimeti]|uniref:Uncharacterized protein n=1 Tax=Chaetomium fimeti TaxID=1854472 RepID=A0AAE0HLQ7_9PEZI|nr:hypothetical protein B0H64DRAFT_386452 [Chaetomium fimeti]